MNEKITRDDLLKCLEKLEEALWLTLAKIKDLEIYLRHCEETGGENE